MRCPKCASKIEMTKARPAGADSRYVCQACGATLRWSASSRLNGVVKFIALSFVLGMVFEFALGLFGMTSNDWRALARLLAAVVAFMASVGTWFRLEEE